MGLGDLGFRDWVVGCIMGFRVWGFWVFRVLRFGFEEFGLSLQGLGFMFEGLGPRVNKHGVFFYLLLWILMLRRHYTFGRA